MFFMLAGKYFVLLMRDWEVIIVEGRKLHIGICDDESITRDYLSRLVKTDSGEHITKCFSDGREALSYFEAGNSLDLLFLDIDFRNELDGMSVAAKIKANQLADGRALGSLPLIVFVTGMPERMQEAFEVRAFQFLIKPIDEKKFLGILSQAQKEVDHIIKKRAACDDMLSISIGGKQMLLKSSALKYVESEGRKLKLHIKDRVVECYGKMDEISSQVGDDFCQIHRSYIVNLTRVFTYGRTQVEMDDGTKIPMSKYKYKNFLDDFLRVSSQRA